MRLKLIGLIVALAVIAACGGGGGGTGSSKTAIIIGKVIDIESGGAPNPVASIQSGSATTLTQSDGSFSLEVPEGASSISVDGRNGYPIFTFTFVAASGVAGLGDIYIGPQTVTVRGRVLSTADGAPVQGADIDFGGRSTVTGSDGKFSLAKIAYPTGSLAAFWAISGSATAPGFIPNQFTANPNAAVSGIVTLNDIALVPEGDENPPPGPANIWGRISPTDQAPGTVVSLKQGATPIRSYTVGIDATYYFWVQPGSYTISYQNGTLSAPDETVTLSTSTDVVRRDVTIK